MDPVGHYSRPDVFHLSVNTGAKPLVAFEADGKAPANADNGADVADGAAAVPRRRPRATSAGS